MPVSGEFKKLIQMPSGMKIAILPFGKRSRIYMWLCLENGSLDGYGFIPATAPLPDDAITCEASWRGKPITLVYCPGLDHGVEHMLFKGTSDHRFSTVNRVNEYYGPRNRDDEDGFGADTHVLTTRYYTETEPPGLEESMRFLSALTLRSLLGQQSVNIRKRLAREWEKEKMIMKHERARGNDNVELFIHEETEQRMFPGHPLEFSVDGVAERIDALTLAQVTQRYRMRYHPSKMLLVVIGGGVTDAQIKKYVQKYFRSPRRPVLYIPTVVPTTPESPPLRQRVNFVPKKDPELMYIAVSFPFARPLAPETERHPDSIRRYHSIALLKKVLGGRWYSRTYRELRERRGIGYRHYSFREEYPGIGSLMYSTFIFPDKAREWLHVFLRILRNLATKLIPEHEFLHAQHAFIDRLDSARETPGALAEYIYTSVRLTGDVQMFEETKKEILAVTPEDVLAVAREIIVPQRLYATFAGNLPSETVQRQLLRTLKEWKITRK